MSASVGWDITVVVAKASVVLIIVTESGISDKTYTLSGFVFDTAICVLSPDVTVYFNWKVFPSVEEKTFPPPSPYNELLVDDSHIFPPAVISISFGAVLWPAAVNGNETSFQVVPPFTDLNNP